MNPLSNDNRMGWIRNIDKLSVSEKDSYYYEYEFATECRIPGLLNYENGKIICSLFSFEKDKNGLYHYLLKIKYPKFDSYNKKTDKKGYCFIDGTIGELLSLFSLYYQCRFYIVAIYQGELTKEGLGLKTEKYFSYEKTDKASHPKIFSEDSRNFARGLSDFLNSIRTLDARFHQSFILACHHYARSLKEVGIDSEMVFIRLVSAIEILSKDYKLSKKENPLDGEKFATLIDTSFFSREQVCQLKEILKVSKKGEIKIEKSKKKFIRFIDDFSKGCLRGGNWKAKRVKITRKSLPDVLAAIYDSRSSYLHNGEPMYLSLPMRGAGKWDTDISLGMMIDNRKFSVSQKLPYTYWFENIVRHCLLNYLKTKVQIEIDPTQTNR